ncbi:hypothetical protein QVD17_35532 [Tagetes erecta]|uniref:Uncharacterized protein n=1 Tax=Tagetes erecta TaxID=13708 RepID=A0AAD8K045_TARER|nr:hypothetical protein QVD17_35532 [Tagetes erecta]
MRYSGPTLFYMRHGWFLVSRSQTTSNIIIIKYGQPISYSSLRTKIKESNAYSIITLCILRVLSLIHYHAQLPATLRLLFFKGVNNIISPFLLNEWVARQVMSVSILKLFGLVSYFSQSFCGWISCRYQISVIIYDGTADLQATLSHQATTTLIGMDSSELRIIDVCDPIVRMPPHIADLKGKSMTFEIQAQKDSQTGSIKATIHKANETTPETQTPSANPSTTVMTTPTPQTPAKTTQRLQGKRLKFDTPGAESSDSSGSKRQKTKA